MKDIDGGITAPKGFKAGTAGCGIKYTDRDDLAVIASDSPAACAGMFTTNRIQGAPVVVSRENVKHGIARAIVATSGNANVCTGDDGHKAAMLMTREIAGHLGCDSQEVLVASTGIIGRPFPVKKALAGIPSAIGALSADGGHAAARAIMTTDTVPKETAVEIDIGGVPVRIGAIAKGSGMISPNMATMFCFITTDAVITPGALSSALKSAVARSFNCITVDGDMSTSDTVLILANGEAGNKQIGSYRESLTVFTEALYEVCLRMAKAIVRDGEGATRFVTITVDGADTSENARRVGLAIANSALVKTAVFGNDPNWGRIICAAGYSGAPVNEPDMTITINDMILFDAGKPLQCDEQELKTAMSGTEADISVSLGMGKATAIVYTTDLSYEYVKINAEYTT